MDTLAELVAKQAIEEGLYTYCRSLDRMDRGLAESIWHPDATADYGEYYRGDVPGLLDFIWAMHDTLETHAHHVTNKFVELLDDERAVAESYTIVMLRAKPAADTWLDQILSVRYFDRWSTGDGAIWKLDERRGIPDLITAVERPHVADFDAMTEVSRRDTKDPSYAYFEKRFR